MPISPVDSSPLYQLSIVDAGVYTSLLVMTLYGLLQLVFLRKPQTTFYAIFIFAATLVLFQVDGYQLPFGDRPNSLLVGYALFLACLSFFSFSYYFIKLDGFSAPIRRSLYTALLCQLLLAFAYHWLAFNLVVIQGLFGIFIVGVFAFLALQKYRGGDQSMFFYLIANVLLFFFSLFASGLYFLGNPSTDQLCDVGKSVLIFYALAIGLAMTHQIKLIQNQRDLAHQRLRESIENQNAITQELYQVEKQKAEAIAQTRALTRTLQSNVHDIKQPLLSLRLSINRLPLENVPSEEIEQFSHSLKKLISVTESYLTGGN